MAEPRAILLTVIAWAVLATPARADQPAQANLVAPSAAPTQTPLEKSPVSPPDRDSRSSSVEDQSIARPADSALPRRGSDTLAPSRGSLLKMVWPLLAVLAVIVLATWGLRRIIPQVRQSGVTGPIRILARHYLSTKQSICLIRVGGRVLLVGVTPDRIQTLDTVQDADEAARLIGRIESGRNESATAGFRDFMRREQAAHDDTANAPFASAAAPHAGPSARAALRGLRERLRHVATVNPITEAGQ